MGYCDYESREKRSVANGTYCSLRGCYVHDSSIVKYYCNNSIRCVYCPYRGGDDRDRKPDTPVRTAPAPTPIHTIPHTGGGSSGGGGGGTGGGGGGCSGGGFLSDLFGVVRGFVVIVVISVILTGIIMLLGLFGVTGPWVYMQLPAEADPEGISMYAVSREERWLFQVRDEKFDDEKLCKLRTREGYSDIYLEQDGASVWLGTSHLLTLNSCNVEDITYEEALEQMVRPVIIRLHDTAENVLADAAPEVTDAQGNPLSCVDLGDGQYAVLLPNGAAAQALTISAEGYQPLTVDVDTAERLTIIAVSLAAGK